MNKYQLQTLAMPLLAALAMASCSIDDNYDFTEVESDARFEAKDLVVPINIDDVKLKSIIDLKDGDDIKKGPDGYYVEKSGTFHADGIKVEKFSIAGTNLTEKTQTFVVGTPVGGEYTFPFPSGTSTDVSFQANNVDEAIDKIDCIGLKSTVKFQMSFYNLTSSFSDIKFNDMVLHFIPGLDATVSVTSNDGTKMQELTNGVSEGYDAETGDIRIPTGHKLVANPFCISVTISSIDFSKSGATFEAHSISLKKSVSIEGNLSGTAKFPSFVPQSVDFTYGHSVSAPEVTTFSGSITKTFTVTDPAPIDLSNLPEMLQSTGTSIELTDPKLMLSVNNPVIQAGYGQPVVQTGLSLTNDDATYSTAAGAIKLDKAQNDITIRSVADGTSVALPGFGKILTGESIPRKITVKILDTKIEKQEVKDFKLGEKLPDVEGTWTFYTLVSLAENSSISYNKTWDDWSSADLDNLTVTDATVTFTITNNVPLSVKKMNFTLNGKSGSMKGSTEVVIPNNETRDITIKLSGTISQIYGATINVELAGTNAGLALQPEQTITVKNVKAKVSGYYDKEL